MKFQHLFSFLMIILFTNLNSQIYIDADTSVSGQNFKINISENPTFYFIELKIKDSVSKNKEYEAEMDNYREKFKKLPHISIKSDSVKFLLNKMMTLTEKNTFYSEYKSKIMKNKDENFDNLIKSFKKNSVEFLERKEENKNRIVIDGTSVKIEVKDDKHIKTIWSRSPREKSHPEIYNLITSSLKILREDNQLSLDKKLTVGY